MLAREALLLVVGLEDDFQALEIFGEVARGGFVDGFVAAGALLVSDGGLLGVEVADGFAGDEVEAVMLELEVEGGGRECGMRSGEWGVGGGERGLGARNWGLGRGTGDFRFGIWDFRGGAPGFDAAEDLGDAALGEVVFFGELGLAEALDLVVEIDLEVAAGGGGELAWAGAVRFEECGHGSEEF